MKRILALTVTAIALGSAALQGQKDWVYYGQDQGATRYSTLAQITTANVATLKRAWTFHTGDKAGFFESTPLVDRQHDVLRLAGNAFFALDAVTGEQIWKVDAPRATRRGVSYWPGDARTPPRIIASAGTELMALDAKTGKPVAAFGDEGVVELEDSMNSPAAIYKDLAIVQGNKPWIRAWNIRTGKLEWTFNLIPQPGDTGHDTWAGDSWKTAGGTNVWGLHVARRAARSGVPAELDARRERLLRRRRVTATTCIGNSASSRSTRQPASCAGTASSCTTTSGTTISAPRRRWSTS